MTKHDNVSLGGIMKATEFVKWFGWNITKYNLKYHLNESEKLVYMDWILSVEDVDELKRLVESHELVERTGGLRECRLMSYRMNVGDRLAQAIADVEACQ